MEKEKPTNEVRKTDAYSVTEVGTLVESFQKDLSLVAEEVAGFSVWRNGIDSRLGEIEGRLTVIDDAVRLSLPDLRKRVATLESKVEA